MDAVPLIVSSILTSTLVSGAGAAIMKYRFDRKVIELQHNHELFRAETTAKRDEERTAVSERVKERRIIFPKIITKVYRIRNAAREVSQQASSRTVDTKELEKAIQSYQAEQAGLEELLYDLRLYLEIEGLFDALHLYKRETQGFFGSATTILYLARHINDFSKPHVMELQEQFKKAYEEIDQQQFELIHNLAEIIVRGS